MAAVVASTLLLGLVVSGAIRARAAAAEAEARLAQATQEGQEAERRLRALTARTASAETALARASRAFEAPPARVVADVAAILPADVRLERLSLEYASVVTIDLDVVTRDARAWDSLLDRLEREPGLQGVSTGPELREGEVRTTVRARYVGSAR
jgi:Tfp pilus assembly protein PilN